MLSLGFYGQLTPESDRMNHAMYGLGLWLHRRFDVSEHTFFGGRASFGLSHIIGEYTTFFNQGGGYDAELGSHLGFSVGTDLGFDIAHRMLLIFSGGGAKFDGFETTYTVGASLALKLNRAEQ